MPTITQTIIGPAISPKIIIIKIPVVHAYLV